MNLEDSIIISPYSRPNKNGTRNAKNYPFWAEVVTGIHRLGLTVIQVGENHEDKIEGTDAKLSGLSFKQLESMVKESRTWASVDNFFHHFAAYHQKPGVVIFGKSDPNIFGHSSNINLLKDRKYLRKLQYMIWECEPFSSECFIHPNKVIKAIETLI